MDMTNFGFYIINAIIVSIPEETYFVYLSLFILGKLEQIKVKKANMPRFFACVIPSAFLGNILRAVFPSLNDILPLFGIISMFLLILFIYRIKGVKEILRTFFAVVLSFITGMIFQISHVPFLLYGTNIDLAEISKSNLLVLIWSLPERAIEFSILIMLAVGKSIPKIINIFSILSRNKLVTAITMILFTFNVAFLVIMGKLIMIDRILHDVSLLNIVLLIALVVIFPIMNISLLLVVIYGVYYRDTIRRLMSKERMGTLVNILAIYAEDKNYSKIDSLVNDLYNQVDVL